jgi:hypothetical protein
MRDLCFLYFALRDSPSQWIPVRMSRSLEDAPGGAFSQPEDSGFFILGSPAAGGNEPEQFDLAFRQRIADRIHDVLRQAYVTRPEHVAAEARKRGVSCEQLLAAYIARLVMDKVDREYL